MHFVYPFVLWGLLAATLPVIIHLFRLRKFKVVLFSSNRLLRDVQLETRKKSRIKHLIILLLRILAIVALVLAFARPFFPRQRAMPGNENQKTIMVYVDNSFSMEAGESYHSHLSEAKSKAIEIARGFSQSDRYFLFSNSHDPALYRPLSVKQFEEKVSELQISSFAMNFADVLLKFAETLGQFSDENVYGFIISDFQHSFFKSDQLPDSVAHPLFLIPIEGASVPNAGIDSVWFDSPVLQPGRQVVLSTRIRNYSSVSYENMPVELFVNNSRRSVTSVDLGPGGEAVAEMSFVPAEYGIYECYVEIQDSPVTFDNRMFFSFTISQNIRVFAISGGERLNSSISAIFRNEPLFDFDNTSIRQLQFGRIQESQIVILDAVEDPGSGLFQEIEEFVRNGGSLVIIPPARENAGNLNSLMSGLGLDTYGSISPAGLRVSELNMGHELFRGVFDGVPRDMDLPAVKKYFTLQETGINWRLPLIKMQNGLPFLVMSSVGNGKVYYFSCPFDNEFTDFYRHAIVVPVFYQMAFLSSPRSDLYYFIGKNDQITFSGEVKEVSKGISLRITDNTGSVDFIPQVKTEGHQTHLFVHNMISAAGNYSIKEHEEAVQGIAFNYSRDESFMNFYNRTQLDSIFLQNQTVNIEILEAGSSLGSEIQLMVQGKHLWKIFLILALLFLAIEVILLRFWK